MDEGNRLPSQTELNTVWRELHPDLPDFRFKWSARMKRSAGTILYEARIVRLSVKHFIEFGWEELTKTLKHEAAHYLAWSKHGQRGHGEWLWYYLGYFGTTRHCKSLSANMEAARIRVRHTRRKRRIEYDPTTKTLKQVYE